jgi:adenylate kinase family enzyme
MRRIVIVGSPGSGKTTLAGELARALDLTHVELDHLHHRPGWNVAPEEEFRADLRAALDHAPNGWVTDGNYTKRARNLHIRAADTLIWLDLPKRTVMQRVVRRTIRRAVTRERLFGRGMTEPLTNFTRWDPAKNVIRWTWVNFDVYRSRYETRVADGSWGHLVVHRLRAPRDVVEFVARAVDGHR